MCFWNRAGYRTKNNNTSTTASTHKVIQILIEYFICYLLCLFVLDEITPPPPFNAFIYKIQNIFVASRDAELPILSNNRNRLHHSSDFMGISCCGGQSITYCSKSNTWVIRCKQNHKNRHFSLDLDTKRIECSYRLTGDVSVLLGPGLFWSIPSLIPSPILKWCKASSAFHWTWIYKS